MMRKLENEDFTLTVQYFVRRYSHADVMGKSVMFHSIGTFRYFAITMRLVFIVVDIQGVSVQVQLRLGVNHHFFH